MRDAEGAHVHLRERIAVGLGGLRQVARPHRPSGAGPVLDQNRLADVFRGDLGEAPQMGIGRAARGPGQGQISVIGREGNSCAIADSGKTSPSASVRASECMRLLLR